MAQIAYRDRNGNDVCVKDPARADMDAFWEEWNAIYGKTWKRVFEIELRRSGSVFSKSYKPTKRF